ncbi:MAG: hypothetical protein ABUU24_09565, partial [Variovorax sp.]
MIALAGCGSVALGGVDARVDGGSDAGPIAPNDARPASVDAAIDASKEDSGTPIDVRPLVEAIVPLFCEPASYATCRAAWECDCATVSYRDLVGRGDPERCLMEENARCRGLAWDGLLGIASTIASVDEEKIDSCVVQLQRSYELCRTSPAIEGVVPVDCRDAITLNVAIGATCGVQWVRCAGGDGVCVGDMCRPAAGVGESCTNNCDVDLACVGGRCVHAVIEGGG